MCYTTCDTFQNVVHKAFSDKRYCILTDSLLLVDSVYYTEMKNTSGKTEGAINQRITGFGNEVCSCHFLSQVYFFYLFK